MASPTRSVGVIYDTLPQSFRTVAELTIRGLREIGYGDVVSLDHRFFLLSPFIHKCILIGDTASLSRSGAFSAFSFFCGSMVAWLDTVLHVKHIVPEELNRVKHFACLEYWCDIYKGSNIRCDGAIPRPVDYGFLSTYVADCGDLPYGRYVFNIASEPFVYPFPRKGLDLYDELCGRLRDKHGVKCVAVTNYPLRNAYVIRPGVSRAHVAKLIKCAEAFVWTSRSEGFGMPPVEANACGQVVVSSDAPFNQHFVALRFKHTGVAVRSIPFLGDYYSFEYSVDDLYETVVQALGLTREERLDLAVRGMEKAKEFSYINIVNMLMGELG